jgi:hypothetical protein
MSGLILPNATLGVVHPVGEILTKDFRSGVVVFVRENMTVFRFLKDGQKMHDIEFGGEQTEQMAEFFKKAADMISKQGGSGLPPTRVVAPTLIEG